MSVVEVGIGHGTGPGQFRVVVRSPAGEAAAEVSLDAGTLLAGRAQFEQTLLVSGVAARRLLTAAERAVQETGQALFAALLGSGEVAGRYRASAALAEDRGEELRIVLRLDAPELAALPWEAMYDPGTGGYVCREHQLVRHIPVAAVPPPLAVRPPLRILGVISAPRELAGLGSGQEVEQLTRTLAPLAGQGMAELAWAPSATWAGLHEMLLAGPWHVLHFIGHGSFDPDRDEGMLALTRQDGTQDLVEASRFASLLRRARPMPRLVVLNSCSGAAASQVDLFSGTAAALARNGVAAVTAMQYSISDTAAVAFARGFYAALAHGRGVDEAVSDGRIAILGTSGQTMEWITPVVYLRGHDAQLFTIPTIRNRVPTSSQLAEPAPATPSAQFRPADVPSGHAKGVPAVDDRAMPTGQRLRITVVAPHRGALPDGRDARFYGPGAKDWNPYQPDSARPIVDHAAVLARGLGYRVDIGDLYQHEADLLSGRPPAGPQILIVDPWALMLPRCQHLLEQIDPLDAPWVQVVILLNHRDTESMNSEAKLHAALEATLRRKLGEVRGTSAIAGYGISTLDDFSMVLPKLILSVVKHFLRNAQAYPPAGPAVERPRLGGFVSDLPTSPEGSDD